MRSVCFLRMCVNTLSLALAPAGGYTLKGEDYRWPVLRERFHPIAFQLLNLVFIAPFQNVLLLWIAAPVYVCARLSGPAATVISVTLSAPSATHAAAFQAGEAAFKALLASPSLDAVSKVASTSWAAIGAAFSSVFVDGNLRLQHVVSGWSTLSPAVLALCGAFLVLLLIETIADQQQWRFQNAKYALAKDKWAASASAEIRDGFCHSGLFRFSRHPNFAAEQVRFCVGVQRLPLCACLRLVVPVFVPSRPSGGSSMP